MVHVPTGRVALVLDTVAPGGPSRQWLERLEGGDFHSTSGMRRGPAAKVARLPFGSEPPTAPQAGLRYPASGRVL